METEINARFNGMILNEITGRFIIEPDSISVLPGFMNILYQCNNGTASFVLRVTHSSRRTENIIEAECDWITYLYENALSVAYPVISRNNRYVEKIEDCEGEYFLATLFMKAPGKHPVKSDLNASFYKKYGQFLGKMHSLSKKYSVKNPLNKRLVWDDWIKSEIGKDIPQSEEKVLEKYTQLLEYLRKLPRDCDSFGLIHQDLHTGNMFIDDSGKITVFDFDDAAYSWFINDISIVLFYIAMVSEKPEAFVTEFFKYFYDGYSRENEINSSWFKEIQYFLKLREMDIFTLIYNNHDGEIAHSKWAMDYMEKHKLRIEQNIPYLEIDFQKLV